MYTVEPLSTWNFNNRSTLDNALTTRQTPQRNMMVNKIETGPNSNHDFQSYPQMLNDERQMLQSSRSKSPLFPSNNKQEVLSDAKKQR
jgi:hypothetical protein